MIYFIIAYLIVLIISLVLIKFKHEELEINLPFDYIITFIFALLPGVNFFFIIICGFIFIFTNFSVEKIGNFIKEKIFKIK